MKLNSIHNVIKSHQCLGCGLCGLFEDKCIIVEKEGMLAPSMEGDGKRLESICPAKGYDIKTLGQDLFGNVNYRYEVGYYRSIGLVSTNDTSVLENASSGGAITQIAFFLLKNKLVDGVITTKFVYEGKVRTQSYIATTIAELIEGQGSKYCPTDTLSVLKTIDITKKQKYALIGTPCQIAGFRLLSKEKPEWASVIPYTIANFCGGYRDYREVDFFCRDIAKIENVTYFRHRGGNPNGLYITDDNGHHFSAKYPEYANLSPFVKNLRCTLCIDAMGELADFSCGDAWLDKPIAKTKKWSIVICRSNKAEQVIDKMMEEEMISYSDDINAEELIESQRSNLTSKKYRQHKRLVVRNLFLQYSPYWFGCIEDVQGSYIQELKVILSKKLQSIKTKGR